MSSVRLDGAPSDARPAAGPRALRALALALLIAAATALRAQETPPEYREKAAHLFNFAKYIEWPKEPGPLTICVAGRNVFGDSLADIVRGETIDGRPLAVRVLLEPEPGCHITFVPRGAAASAYLRAARAFPELTVGESPDFIAQGGIINFVVEDGNVRFEIDAAAAERSALRISSRLLQLARQPGGP